MENLTIDQIISLVIFAVIAVFSLREWVRIAIHGFQDEVADQTGLNKDNEQ